MDLGRIFWELDQADYRWVAKNPEQLRTLRNSQTALRPLERYFGLGLSSVLSDELLGDGLSQATLKELNFKHGVQAPIAVSGASAQFDTPIYTVHDHWPPRPGLEAQYTHLSSESFFLVQKLEQDLPQFLGKKVLDLGCGSGALSLSVAPAAREVLGLDLCTRGIEFAQKTASIYGLSQCTYLAYGIPSIPQFLELAQDADAVVMNPPIAIPSPGLNQPHRDGGKYGLQVPLQFLDFAALHLKPGGEVYTTLVNPVLRDGTSVLWEELKKRGNWNIEQKTCLHSRFNHKLAKKEGYQDQTVSHIELWFLVLSKNAQKKLVRQKKLG